MPSRRCELWVPVGLSFRATRLLVGAELRAGPPDCGQGCPLEVCMELAQLLGSLGIRVPGGHQGTA